MRGLNLSQVQLIKDKIFHSLGIAYIFTQLDKIGISPNYITATGKLFGLLSIYYLCEDPIYFALFYIAHQIMDGFDGSYARFSGRETSFGREFDHMGDLVIHSLILVKSIFLLPDNYIASVALLTYIGEFLILRTMKLDNKKFPTSLFAVFYIFGLYKLGLIIQIAYQLISLPIFLYLNRKRTTPITP